MRRRMLLVSAAMGSILPSVPAADRDSERRVALGDMVFAWRHQSGRLHGHLSAPGSGWLAVGFNEARELRGTRFVIAAVAVGPPRAEVHIALPPDHRPIESLVGQPSGLRDLSGSYENGRSQLWFSLPHHSADRFAQDLSPGRATYLMLAWSHAPEFDHHSAWRGHANVTL